MFFVEIVSGGHLLRTFIVGVWKGMGDRRSTDDVVEFILLLANL